MADMIKFFKGLEANLPASGVNGALYITTDEGAIYLGTGSGMKRLGDFVQVDNVASLPEKAHESCLYYCVAENILAKWNGSEWKQINKQPTAEELKGLLGLGSLAYLSEVAESNLNADLAAKINTVAQGNHSHDNKGVIDGITAEKVAAWDASEQNAKDYADGLDSAMNTRVAALEAIDHEHSNKALLDTYTQTEADLADAVAKKHAHTFNETELNKIVAGDVQKWNNVASDYLDSEDKAALEDSIDDVNTALESYKTSNNEALAGVKATADAAATKTYTDEELAKKVAKTDYEADKATFATKTDIAKLAGVSEGANKVEASANNGSIKIDGVETVVYTHPEKHAIADVTGLQDAIDAKVAKSDYEADKATFATKTELGNVDAKFASYVTSASYAIDKAAIDKAIEDESKARSDADAGFEERIAALEGNFGDGEGTVEAQIAAAVKVEEDARKEAVKGVQDEVDGVKGRMDTAEGKIADLEAASATHAIKTEVEGALALKADKSALEETDATLAEVKATVDNFFAEDAAINDTIDTLKEIAAYIANDKEGAADITARVGALEGKVDVEKVSTAISTAVQAEVDRATGIENGLAGRIKDLEDNKAGYATTGEVATAKQEAIDAAASDAEGKVNALANGQVKTNTEAIAANAAAITSGDEATLASAKSYCDNIMLWGEF